MELSDFIEIDRRIVDYVAEDYQPTNYNSAANEPSYSFMDAFEVYEDEKYEHHEVMNVEEALEALIDGTIQWYIVDEKILVLQLGNFEVYAGTYFEFDDDDAHEPEIIDQFIKIFKEQVSVGIPETAFDRFSSQNIGLDKDFLYIYFPAKGIWSFHDYYILHIPRKELVFYIDI